jgi:hypothetical protein
MSPTVTANAVRTVVLGLQSASADCAFLPIFQVISIHAMRCQNGGTVQRCGAVLSNGTHFLQGMLVAIEDELTVNSLVQVKDFMSNDIRRNVIFLLKLKVLNNPGARIGDPTEIENAGASTMASDNHGGAHLTNNQTGERHCRLTKGQPKFN